MRVYLFKDYLKLGIGNPVGDLEVVAEIEPIKTLPNGFVEIAGRLARVCCLNINSSSACYIEWVKRDLLNKDEIDFENEAQCPHCGSYSADSWEFLDEDECECGDCGTGFSILRNIEVTYSTKVINRNSEITKLLTK